MNINFNDIPVSDYPDWLSEETAAGEKQEDFTPCPDCGSVRFNVLPVCNGPFDFRYEYECVECGLTFEE